MAKASNVWYCLISSKFNSNRTRTHRIFNRHSHNPMSSESRGREKLKALMKRAALVCYFVGIMRVYTNRVKIYGAVRKAEYINKLVEVKDDHKTASKCLVPLLSLSIPHLIYSIISPYSPLVPFDLFGMW